MCWMPLRAPHPSAIDARRERGHSLRCVQRARDLQCASACWTLDAFGRSRSGVVPLEAAKQNMKSLVRSGSVPAGQRVSANAIATRCHPATHSLNTWTSLHAHAQREATRGGPGQRRGPACRVRRCSAPSAATVSSRPDDQRELGRPGGGPALADFRPTWPAVFGSKGAGEEGTKST